MKSIQDVMRQKSMQSLVTVAPTDTVVHAASLMTRWNVGALLVMDDDRLVGLLSERDFVRALATVGRPPPDLHVGEIMTTAVRVVDPDISTDECMGLMTHLRLRHLPVVEGDRVVGILSVGDLVKDVIGDQSFVIDQLEAYISRAANA